jgi:hypothetical protein
LEALWYDSWMAEVRKYCMENGTTFKSVEADDPDDSNIPW